MAKTAVENRDNKGRFVKGKSGNPAGRPLGSKNRIAALKREMEQALRENMDPKVIRPIIDAMISEALSGNVQAAKLILDKVMTNAGKDDDVGEEKPEIVIRIENLTPQHIKEVEGVVIEHEEEHG